ncbi:sarcosine oxidase subunit alpha family protein [Pararhodobacter aggregans]|uniref:Sarcosine oxidase subunit alpha family protein n=1 Tax=Pararhodobacter aggregans TaxID=404875 RepID=A0A2T7UNL9_9RHOB|nr:sarcosine oxidase subunit alpha family protein [Pararhodobacter aggregans]PTX00772.1 sarcosine oxidase subunit alpha [Pararhodobacter aggregans]PVE46303.1 sarcosine oxidase subunit alpha family protein [Pararhodobacter aggregans]
MSHRLGTGGRLIDRARPMDFTFNGKTMRGYAGDTLAAALLGAGQTLVGRSFKYHRPRGIMASGAEEPNALVGLGEGQRYEPNQRVTTTELFPGLKATSQNHWPSLEFDVGAINAKLWRFFPAGFYYKTFIAPRPFWKHLYEPIIRRSAGLGRAPDAETHDADRYEQIYAFCDVLVAGGGIAGLKAAREAAEAGKRVILTEQNAHFGGRAVVDGIEVDGQAAGAWVSAQVAALSAMANVTVLARTMVSGVYDHGYALAYQRIADHTPGAEKPRHRLWRIRAGQIVAATGAIERPLSFAGNDLPGVMLASAVRDYVVNWAVSPGKAVAVVTNNDDAYRTALALHSVGVKVPAVIDARREATGDLPARARAAGIRVIEDAAVRHVEGGKAVTGVAICRFNSDGGAVIETLACDALAMSGGWSPVVHLWSHCGGKLLWNEAGAFFRPDPQRPPLGADGKGFVTCVGAANGDLGTEGEAPMLPVWLMPAQASYDLRAKAWLDPQNDVKVSDVQLAAQEGYASVEHTKRYTTLGMATDQGKLSNINGLAILSDALGQPIPQTGTTTFRPPYTPISLGAIAGEARGGIFQPLRKTPMYDWHLARGAHWEPVGHWRRPYCYPQAGESHAQAVNREITQTRKAVGILDASTLGKLVVKGPDAGRFLDMLYTNVMSSLKVGKCRYGLMCNENGFLSDDGVVARLSEDTWLCHTTSGGADRIHGWMEDWLQCEWWDWKVHVVNLTEQFAQIAVVGPKARTVLEKLGGDMDLSAEAFPFMDWKEGHLGGIPARIFRISFSGELSYEVAVPAGQGLALWERLMEAGAEFGVAPYGTEALHVMRAEKGFIMIGDETDGTVIPQDLGLSWAISKKKSDFLGKRGMEREAMVSADRWQLVGLETLDGSVLPDGALAPLPGKNDNGQQETQGRVTSTYYSPTLGKGIAMALLHKGPERMGETVEFQNASGGTVAARVVDPCFYDKAGEKQNV